MSETVLLKNMYQNPSAKIVDDSSLEVDDAENVKHFEEFYEDVFSELSSFGKIDEMIVADNIGDHLVGNVYVKFHVEEDADGAIKGLNGRFYGGIPIQVEFTPVTEFKEARCRQHDLGECARGGYCNFIHIKEISHSLSKKLFPMRYIQRREKSPERADRRHRRSVDRNYSTPKRSSRCFRARDDRYTSEF